MASFKHAARQNPPLSAAAVRLASKFLSPEQLAQILHVHVGTLRRWRNLGEGPPYARVGRRVLYHADSVDDYIRLQGGTRQQICRRKKAS
jgi:excisionase family DNA binding protein